MATEAQATEAAPAAATAEAPAAADGSPLGLAAFALTLTLLSGDNANLIHTGGLVFVGMALFGGGLAVFIAGMWEFRNRNIFGATAFSAYGAFWLGLGILIVFQVVGRPTGGPLYTGDGAIWYLFLWAVFTTYMWVITLRTNAVVMAIFLLLALALWALWLGAKGGDLPGHGWTGFGGILGFLTAAVAFYGSFAGVINTVWGRAVAPVFPLTRG